MASGNAFNPSFVLPYRNGVCAKILIASFLEGPIELCYTLYASIHAKCYTKIIEHMINDS